MNDIYFGGKKYAYFIQTSKEKTRLKHVATVCEKAEREGKTCGCKPPQSQGTPYTIMNYVR